MKYLCFLSKNPGSQIEEQSQGKNHKPERFDHNSALYERISNHLDRCENHDQMKKGLVLSL
jgi:hypothetical protein